MIKPGFIFIFLISISASLFTQSVSLDNFLADTSMRYASVSFRVADANTGETVAEYDSHRSLSHASVMKIVTTSAALELLGPDYRFETSAGYSGKYRKGGGVLKGDIIIMGGGDPCLGSERFKDHYEGFVDEWVGAIKSAGIKKVTGRVITYDSYYDYEPVPDGWTWEDIGNYYGAGVYGLSVFDNTIKLHFKTSGEGSRPVLTYVEPEETGVELINNLISSGSTDQGYVYLAPYRDKGWISGTIPVNRDNFILKASLPDPPMLMAGILTASLRKAGIRVKNDPSTERLSGSGGIQAGTLLIKTVSPPLSVIAETINHESVNLYSEHLVKELGKRFMDSGTTGAGIEVIRSFLAGRGIDCAGMFILDGSGLSPQNAISAFSITELLVAMKKNPPVSEVFYNTLPEAGKEGTLKNIFRESLFENRLRAKSGSLTRVRSYAGYIKASSGRELAFSIAVNNYTGTSSRVAGAISGLLGEIIVNY